MKAQSASTPDTALWLARRYDTTPRFCLNFQTRFDLKRAEKDCAEVSPLPLAA
ncbi:MAG TPA: hypothetical protein PKL28_13820 [Rhodocyclaceae bacterium]|jgi:plasmid maintenance system antidote protein VapI|nr:hypothetical protein [Rhodocyclaceae bacterium]HMW77974.1 hypothetical protein [Rhodocyclaceae bacterium]HNE43416.1 hypothetical protein [Rhodocyclaceae bacterium]HNL22128.1 hypothetical protein [Rhodocyclaceae bacterium]HNM23272.1 hypothetical protein [Rhodocyclaceae bacterium]